MCVVDSHANLGSLAAQRLILAEAVHFCLLMLHRPFLMHGAEEPDSDISAKASVKSARTVIFCATELERTVWAARKVRRSLSGRCVADRAHVHPAQFPNLRRHSHAAAIVLALHLLDCARQSHEEPLAAVIREEIDAALVHASDGASRLVRALLAEAARRTAGKTDAHDTPLSGDARTEEHPSSEAPTDAPRLDTTAAAPTAATGEAASIEQALQMLDAPRSVDLYFAQLLSASVPHAPPEDLWSTLDRALPSA